MAHAYLNYTAFGKTRRCKAELHNMVMEETPEEFLWVERGEDYFSLMSSQFKDKRVAIIRKEDWLQGEDITTLEDW